MNALQQTIEQFRQFFNDSSASQRVSLVLVVLLVAGGLGYLVYQQSSPDEEALLGGKQFTADEAKTAQEALRSTGMTEFRLDAGKLYVPRTKASSYNAALVTANGLPQSFGQELAEMHKNMNPFISNKHREELIEDTKARAICTVIRAIPEVADASLVSSKNRAHGLYGSTRTTAMLSVKPKGMQEISTTLGNSLRMAVAGALNMSPDDVTVLDTRRGKVIRASDPSDPYGTDFLDRKRQFAEEYQRKLELALHHIPNVVVAVNVELDSLKMSREQSLQHLKPFPIKTSTQEESEESRMAAPIRQPGVRPNMPAEVSSSGGGNDRNAKKTIETGENMPGDSQFRDREYEPLPPKSVQATVSLPDDYFRQVAIQQGESEADAVKFKAKVKEIRERIVLEVQGMVATLLPPPTPPTTLAEMVKVQTYDRLDAPAAMADAPLTSTLSELAAQYAGPLALCLFAVWAVVTLQRTLPKPPPEPAPIASPTGSKPGGEDDDEDDAPAKPTTPRDKLQTVVRDNPEMAAAVLERWIKHSKN